MDAPEHQEGGHREDDEDNDGRRDDGDQRGHAVAGKLFGCGQKRNIATVGFYVAISDLWRRKIELRETL